MKQNDVTNLCIGHQKDVRYRTSPGEEYYEEKVLAGVDEDGQWKFETVNKIKISDYINSFADQCDMRIILQKLKEGDTSVLNQRASFYGDAVNVPHTQAEALQIMIDSRKKFDSLSDAQKKAFDGDFQKWFSTVGTVSWFDKMGLIKKEEVQDVKEEAAAAAES